MVSECYAVQRIVNGEENPQNASTPWDCVTPLEDTTTGNMHKHMVEITHVVQTVCTLSTVNAQQWVSSDSFMN